MGEEVERSILTTLWRLLPRISFLYWMLILRYISMSFFGLMLHIMFSETDWSTCAYITRPKNLSVIGKVRKGSGRDRSLRKHIHKDNRKKLHIVLLKKEQRFVIFPSLIITDLASYMPVLLKKNIMLFSIFLWQCFSFFLFPSETGGFLDPGFNLLFLFVRMWVFSGHPWTVIKPLTGGGSATDGFHSRLVLLY